MSEHTKEPWYVVKRAWSGEYAVDLSGDDASRLAAIYRREDAARIVACINACAGIPTAALEAAAMRSDQAGRLLELRAKAEFHAWYGTPEGSL